MKIQALEYYNAVLVGLYKGASEVLHVEIGKYRKL